jgi:predicted dehydrogenase
VKEETTVNKVRIGVVGVGGMGQGHCSYMDKLSEGKLTAVCDVVPAVADEVSAKHGVPAYYQHADLLDSGLVDAVLIATPHYFHPPIAIDAFKRGIHVLSEKPIGVTVKAIDRMIRAAERSGKVFSVMFQMRCDPERQAAKKLIDDGRIGEIQRVNMIMGWYRSQAYYDSGGWRGTWGGEGGGVLLNQAPHGLDQLTWLAGTPSRVTAQIRTRLHDVEVEDEAFALLEYPNGAHGYIYAGVIESPQTTRLEIVGSRGKLLFDEGGLHFWEMPKPIEEYTHATKSIWGTPEAKQVKVPLKKHETGHIGITRNFCRAILRGEPLIAPGSEGLWSLELANAMILSSYQKQTVRLPLKRQIYEDLIEKLRARTRPKKRVRDQRVTDTQFCYKVKGKKKGKK